MSLGSKGADRVGIGIRTCGWRKVAGDETIMNRAICANRSVEDASSLRNAVGDEWGGGSAGAGYAIVDLVLGQRVLFEGQRPGIIDATAVTAPSASRLKGRNRAAVAAVAASGSIKP